jgi:DNA-binding transcriptional ArsR family regulator
MTDARRAAATAAVVLDALGDPTRRRVLELLREGERTVRELTDELPVSQPAVSQHLRVLREAGLVDVRPAGTRRLYRVDRDGLGQVRAWVDSFWDDVLAAFVEHADREEDPS